MRIFRFASPAGFLLRLRPAAVYAAFRRFIASDYSFLASCFAAFSAGLCVFARNSSFLSLQHTITRHSSFRIL